MTAPASGQKQRLSWSTSTVRVRNTDVSKLTLLGFGILAWGGSMALVAFSFPGRVGQVLAAAGGLAATAGLVVSIVGAARHGEL